MPIPYAMWMATMIIFFPWAIPSPKPPSERLIKK